MEGWGWVGSLDVDYLCPLTDTLVTATPGGLSPRWASASPRMRKQITPSIMQMMISDPGHKPPQDPPPPRTPSPPLTLPPWRGLEGEGVGGEGCFLKPLQRKVTSQLSPCSPHSDVHPFPNKMLDTKESDILNVIKRM